jgi:hypothetical protein
MFSFCENKLFDNVEKSNFFPLVIPKYSRISERIFEEHWIV